MTKNSIEKFSIHIPRTVLIDLRDRIKNTSFPEEKEDSGWNYGTSIGYMRELVRYWAHKYKWRKNEAYLNTFAQFITEIDGVKIHFIHEKSKKENAPALILTHGWPDSFYRFHKVIPLLKKEFNVIVPSLPGFGFSDRIPMQSADIADLWVKLMTERLGYQSFYAAGGDVGSLVSRALAMNHADVVTGIHLTDIGYPTGQEKNMTKAEQDLAAFVQEWLFTKGAYAITHNTKPNSIAFGLTDSPIGLAAWMISMIDVGAENHDVEKAFGSKDEIITNIILYWVTQTAASSVRSYAEEAKTFGRPPIKSKVPAAFAAFPREAPVPKEWVERFVTVKRFKKMPEGGHFAALEMPEVFAKELIDSFKEITPK